MFALVSALLPAPIAAGQSGRVRPRPPQPAPTNQPPPEQPSPEPPAPSPAPGTARKPAPQPSPARPVPPGGRIAAQSAAGAIIRTELANGVVLVARENPATALVSIRLEIATGPAPSDALAFAAARAAVRADRPQGSVEQQAARTGATVRIDVEQDVTSFVADATPDGAGTVIAALSALGGPVAAASIALDDEPATDPADFAEAARSRVARAARGPGAAAPAAAPAAADVAAFLADRYRAERASLFVAGNVNPFNVGSEVQVVFGAWPAAAAVAAPPPPPPAAPDVAPAATVAQRSSSYRMLRADSGIAFVTVGYDVGNLAGPTAAAAEVATAALACGRTSRLGRTLRGAGLASDVDGDVVWGPYGGSIVIQVGCDPKRIDTVEATLFREIDRLRRVRLSDGELQRARNIFELRFLRSRQTVDAETETLAHFEGATRDPAAVSKYVERVRSVDAAALQVAAAQALSSGRAVVDEVLPFDAAERAFTTATFADTVRTWAPGASDPVEPASVKDADPLPAVSEGPVRRSRDETGSAVLLPVPVGVKDFSTLNGPKAFVREDQSRPLLSVGFFFPAGRASEAPDQRGVTLLMLRSMVDGSRKRPGDKLLRDFEQLGAEVTVVSADDYFGVVVDMLSRNADLVMDIAVDAVERPALAKEDVAREREALLLDQRAERARADARSVELFWQNRYPTHAYGAPPLGSPEAVAKLTDESVRAWYAQTVATQYPLVGIVGDTDGSSLVSRHLVDSFDRPEGEPAKSPVLPSPNVAGDTVEATRRDLTVQTLGYPCPGAKWAALDALDVVAAACGAEAERRRLGGALRVTVRSSPGDAPRARDAAAARITRVAGADLTDPELAAARMGAAIAFHRRAETFDAVLFGYTDAAASGTPIDAVEGYDARLRDIGAGDVRRTAAAVVVAATAGCGIVRGQK